METAAIGIGREYNEVSVIVAHWYNNNNNNKWGVAHSLACFGIVLIPFKREEKKNGRNPDLIYIIFRFPYIFFLMSSIPHIIIATWKEERKKEKSIFILIVVYKRRKCFSSLLLFLTVRHSLLAEDGVYALLFS